MSAFLSCYLEGCSPLTNPIWITCPLYCPHSFVNTACRISYPWTLFWICIFFQDIPPPVKTAHFAPRMSLVLGAVRPHMILCYWIFFLLCPIISLTGSVDVPVQAIQDQTIESSAPCYLSPYGKNSCLPPTNLSSSDNFTSPPGWFPPFSVPAAPILMFSLELNPKPGKLISWRCAHFPQMTVLC